MEQKTDNKQSYKGIFKATSLFGGLQFYQILISVIKSKFVAVLLGPLGIGVQGLLTSATDLIKQVTALGISQSAVRDVSEAYASGDSHRVSLTVTILRRVVWLTGLLGMLTVMVLSPYLSLTTFGNYDYTFPFIFLSVTLLIEQLCAGQKVILQGMRRLKDLAKASALGSTLGLFISIPIYYLFRIDGIVPTLILNALISLLLSWYFSRKIDLQSVNVSTKHTFTECKSMLRMGVAMSISGIMLTATAYILRSFIRGCGGTEDVGLFQAGFVILNTYVGLIFSAMATDYYPRLAAVNKDNIKCFEVVSQQGEIAVLIMAPMLSVCTVFMPLVLTILYSTEFLLANDYILLATVGMMFKLASWLISYMIVAKAESRLFITCEITANIYSLLFNVIGYKLWGLSGLGLAFTFNYFIYFLQVYLIARKKYNLKLSKSFIRYFSLFSLLIVANVVMSKFIYGWLYYLIGIIVIVIISTISLIGMNRRLDIKSFVINRYGKTQKF